MPELPEVQTIISQIRPYVVGQTITGLKVLTGGQNLIGNETQSSLERKTKNKRVIDLTRVGKFFILELDQGSIVGHLRMTGLLEYSPIPKYRTHTRLDLLFEDKGSMLFHDIRRFATFHYSDTSSNYKGILNLGPDALTNNFSAEYLQNQLKRRKKSIYSSLMDQSIVAGLGNIYVNEVLFACGINPETPSNQVAKSLDTCESIIQQAKRILIMAINHKGTTLVDNTYKTAYGEYGQFFNQLKVYDRQAQVCSNCSYKIEKIKIGGRSVYRCPNCQN